MSTKRRRRLLRDLATAERMRGAGWLTEVEHAALAVWTVMTLIKPGLRDTADRFEGEPVETAWWLSVYRMALEGDRFPHVSEAELRQYGNVGIAPQFIRDHIAGAQMNTPHAFGAFFFSPALTEAVRRARRRVSRTDRLLRPIQASLQSFKDEYPLVFSAGAFVLAAILTAVIGFAAGRFSAGSSTAPSSAAGVHSSKSGDRSRPLGATR